MSPSDDPRSALPAELFDAILEHVAVTDLLSVCRVNSFVRDIALRRLYRSIRLKRCLPTIQLCHVLVSRPALARYVVSLDIQFGNVPSWQVRQWMPNPVFTATFGSAYYRLVFRAIRAMSNLKSIIFTSLVAGDRMASDNLALCAPPGLTHLQLFDNKHITQMLQLHPALEKLELPNSQHMNHEVVNSLAALPSNALPSLREVHCSHRLLRFVVADRPVERVRIEDAIQQGELRRCLEYLSRSTRRIKCLELAIGVIPLPELSLDMDLAHLLPYLEELEVNGLFEESYLLTQLIEPPDLIVLHNLRCLRRLSFSCRSLIEEPDLRVLAVRLGTECATLTELTVVHCKPMWSIAGRGRFVARSCTRNTTDVGAGDDWQFREDFVPSGLR